MMKINRKAIIVGSLVAVSLGFGQGMHMQGTSTSQMPMMLSNPHYPDWGQMGMMQGSMMGMGSMMSGGMMGYGMMGRHSIFSTTTLSYLFQRALFSTAYSDKKKEIESLKSSIITKVIRQKAELQIAETELNNLLSNPDFDPGAVKKALKKATDAKVTLKTTILDGLLSLRKILGEEGFRSVYPSPYFPGMMEYQQGMSR